MCLICCEEKIAIREGQRGSAECGQNYSINILPSDSIKYEDM